MIEIDNIFSVTAEKRKPEFFRKSIQSHGTCRIDAVICVNLDLMSAGTKIENFRALQADMDALRVRKADLRFGKISRKMDLIQTVVKRKR